MADPNIIYYGDQYQNDADSCRQIYADTCAIKSQQMILNDFGVKVSEDELVAYSVEHGWYDGDGMAMEDVGKILTDAGIPCTQSYEANVFDLVNELAQGHKVIVAVDSGELWNNSFWEWLKDLFFGETPDHALIVAGIDMTDPDNPMVILTDPGTGQMAEPYPLDQFMEAWGDSSNYMVSTDVPTPDAIESFTENGDMEMHLSHVAGVDYEKFREFQVESHHLANNETGDMDDFHASHDGYVEYVDSVADHVDDYVADTVDCPPDSTGVFHYGLESDLPDIGLTDDFDPVDVE